MSNDTQGTSNPVECTPYRPDRELLKKVDHLIGTLYDESVKAQIIEATGLTTVAGPDDIVTADIRNDRVKVQVDDQGLITDIHTG